MKLWKVVVKDTIAPEIQRKIKRLLQPILEVYQPGKCFFCGTLTTWGISRKNVCPACHVKYGFVSADRIPAACEVCGRQGEWWCAGGKTAHSLCYIHRDAWFHWRRSPELDYINSEREPEKGEKVWEDVWNKFVAFMKERPEPT